MLSKIEKEMVKDFSKKHYEIFKRFTIKAFLTEKHDYARWCAVRSEGYRAVLDNIDDDELFRDIIDLLLTLLNGTIDVYEKLVDETKNSNKVDEYEWAVDNLREGLLCKEICLKYIK